MELRTAIQAFTHKLEEGASYYEKTAPTVEEHIDDLYRRINSQPELVTLAEMLSVEALWAGDDWEQPNYATNRIYKLRNRLGMDTAGNAGF